MRSMNNVMHPGTVYFVELFPFLKHIPSWFPGAHFKQLAHEGRRLVDEARYGAWDQSLKEYAEGQTRPSVFMRLMDSCEDAGHSMERVRDSCVIINTGKLFYLLSGFVLSTYLSRNRHHTVCPSDLLSRHVACPRSKATRTTST